MTFKRSSARLAVEREADFARRDVIAKSRTAAAMATPAIGIPAANDGSLVVTRKQSCDVDGPRHSSTDELLVAMPSTAPPTAAAP